MGEDDETDDRDFGWSDTPIDGEEDPFADDLDFLGAEPVEVLPPTFADRVTFFRERGMGEADAVAAAREYDGPV